MSEAVHARKTIRDRVVELLTENLPADCIVFASRAEPLFDKVDLPAICVYTHKETSESFHHQHILDRKLELAIEILADGFDELDDTLDEIAKKIEDILLTEPAKVWQDLDLQSTETAFDGEGRRPIGAARLIFLITYQSTHTRGSYGT